LPLERRGGKRERERKRKNLNYLAKQHRELWYTTTRSKKQRTSTKRKKGIVSHEQPVDVCEDETKPKMKKKREHMHSNNLTQSSTLGGV